MSKMFSSIQATELDLSNFKTHNVTSMYAMFYYSQAAELNLSNFNTSNVTVMDMHAMFHNNQAKIGYARTSSDATKFNNTSGKPVTLKFVAESR